MLDTRAIVVRLEGGEALVEAAQGGGCGACASGGCSSGSMSKMLCVKPRQFRVHNGIGAQIGDEVEVSIPEGALLRSALTLYALPITLLFAGAAAGSNLAADASGHDAGAAAGAAAGLALGFALARIITARPGRVVSSPVITRCMGANKTAVL